jgi:hypothetical protein
LGPSLHGCSAFCFRIPLKLAKCSFPLVSRLLFFYRSF